MNGKKIALMLLVVFLGGFGITTLAHALYFSPETYYFDVKFSVTDEQIAGLNGDTDAIKFGTVSQGNRAIRFVYVEHSKKHPQVVDINIRGDRGMEWVSVSKNGFVLEPGENKKLTFFINIPDNAPVGDYKGKIFFNFKRTFR